MSDKSLPSILPKLVEVVLAKLADPDVDASWARVARDLLRDNNITATPEAVSGLLKLAELDATLPFPGGKQKEAM